jgi:hypothetical protein
MALSKVGKNQVDQSASLTVDGDLTISENVSSPVGITINNPSGSTNGDAILQFTTPSVTTTIGIDATSTDIFKISNSSVLGTSDALAIDSSGKLLIGNSLSQTTDLLQIESPASGGGHGIAIRRNDSNTDQQLGRIKFGNVVDSDIGQIDVKTDGATNSGAMRFSTASSGTTSERMRIDSSGNLLVGSTSNATASPTFFVKQKTGTVASIGGFNLYSASTSADPNNNGIASGGYFNGTSVVATQTTASIYQQYNGNHIWYTNSGLTVGSSFSDTERMRINSSGNLLLNRTSDLDTSMIAISQQDGKNAISIQAPNSNAFMAMQFYNNTGGRVGYIQYSNTATAFSTSSDYRLKENVVADWDATTRLKQLNPVRFNFIADPETTVDGFLAHELATVIPESVTGTHNEVDDDGNPVYQGIDQSKLVPLLVKTIQELEARITALENA